jgi:hypothetical protein
MIIPVTDGYAYLGLKKNMSKSDFIEMLTTGKDIKNVLNKVKLEKGKPVMVAAGVPHAYGANVDVYEIKGVNAAEDSAALSVSSTG